MGAKARMSPQVNKNSLDSHDDEEAQRAATKIQSMHRGNLARIDTLRERKKAKARMPPQVNKNSEDEVADAEGGIYCRGEGEEKTFQEVTTGAQSEAVVKKNPAPYRRLARTVLEWPDVPKWLQPAADAFRDALQNCVPPKGKMGQTNSLVTLRVNV